MNNGFDSSIRAEVLVSKNVISFGQILRYSRHFPSSFMLMLTSDDLIRFADMLTTLRIEPLVISADPMPPLAIGLRIKNGVWSLFPAANLQEPKFNDRSKVVAMVERTLQLKDVIAVATVHEAWMSRVPMSSETEFQERFGHMNFTIDGRAESVMCVLHTKDFQTAIVHGIARIGARRQLIRGPVHFEGLTLGGSMARTMPSRH